MKNSLKYKAVSCRELQSFREHACLEMKASLAIQQQCTKRLHATKQNIVIPKNNQLMS